MKFDSLATHNPIDQLKIVSQPIDRIEGPHKVTGTARYAHERHDVAPNAAHGYVVGSALAKGRIASLDLRAARAASGVLAVLTSEHLGAMGKADRNTARLLAVDEVDHYHQAVAVVVAESFEQARAAASLVRVQYVPRPGNYDLAAAKDSAMKPSEITGSHRILRWETLPLGLRRPRSLWMPPTPRPITLTP